MQALITALAINENSLDQDAWVKLYDKLASKKLKTIQVNATVLLIGMKKTTRVLPLTDSDSTLAAGTACTSFSPP